MLSLNVYKYITGLAQQRADCLSHDVMVHPDRIRTFAGDQFSIHVLTGYEDCRQVLTDPGFIQPKIADAVRTVLSDFPLEASSLELFLRNNPIQMDGAEHRAARQRFMRDFTAAQRSTSYWFGGLADRAFAHFIEQGSSQVSKDLVTPYVDSVITLIFAKHYGVRIDKAAWESAASPIFEFFHTLGRLKAKGQEVTGVLQQLAGSPVVDTASQVTLLSYFLQGRDPMIGALTACMCWLYGLDDPARQDAIAAINARELFWRTSPVNYIGRTATEDTTIAGTLIRANDQLILMLPFAGHDNADSSPASSLAFGAGSHICAGQALAFTIADAWLAALKTRFRDIDWSAGHSDTAVPGVFRQHRD